MNSTSSGKQPISQITKGYLICLLGTTLWATTAIFIRYLTENYQLPAMVLAFWRDAFIAVALCLVFRSFSPGLLRIDKKHFRFIFFYGLILALFNSSWTLSVALNGAAVSTVLAYSSAAYTAILGWRLFGESLSPTKLVAVSLGLIGCVLVSGAYEPSAWQLNPFGIITGILSGMLFAGYSLMGKASANRGISSWSALLYTFFIAAILLLAYNLIGGLSPVLKPTTNLFWLGTAFTGWLVLLTLAIIPSVGGYGFYTLSLTFLPVSIANLIALLEPGMTAILAYFILGETLTFPQLFGGILIVSGVVILRLRETGYSHKP
ncbi:MAG: EamA family transporter [Anaerolineales bacterium]|nr:EamA family transporter [Anaerolineales bacterium]